MKTKIKKSSFAKWTFYFCIILFPLIQFGIMYVGVNVSSLVMAFRKYDAIKGEWSWNGFKNFNAVFYDIGRKLPSLHYAFTNSVKVWLVNLFITLPLGLLFAYYIFMRGFGWNFFRVVLFLPSIISGMVLAIMFKYYADTLIPGVINDVFHTKLTGLLSNNDTQFTTILFFNVFIGFGVSVLMYTGAMVSISESVIEAAELDGANEFQEFIFVIFPQIFGTVSVFIITGIAGIFTNQLNLQAFNNRLVDAPANTYTMGYFIYASIQEAGSAYAIYPYYSCLSFLLTLLIAPVVLFLRWIFNKVDPAKA